MTVADRPQGLDWERVGRDLVARSRTRPGHSWVLVTPEPTISASGTQVLSRDPYTVNLVTEQTDESVEYGTAPSRMHAAHLAARLDWAAGQDVVVTLTTTVVRQVRFSLSELAALTKQDENDLLHIAATGAIRDHLINTLDPETMRSYPFETASDEIWANLYPKES